MADFWELSTDRAAGFGVLLPIPWSSMDRYADRNGFADDEVEYGDFMYVMRSLDNTYLAHSRKESKRADKKPRVSEQPPGAGGRPGKPRGNRRG